VLDYSALAPYAGDRLPQQQFVPVGSNALATWLPGVVTSDRGHFVGASAAGARRLAFGNWLEARVIATTPLLESGTDRTTADVARADGW
jgi:hypothetical protein